MNKHPRRERSQKPKWHYVFQLDSSGRWHGLRYCGVFGAIQRWDEDRWNGKNHPAKWVVIATARQQKPAYDIDMPEFETPT